MLGPGVASLLLVSDFSEILLCSYEGMILFSEEFLLFRVTESTRLEKTYEIIESNL